MAEDPIYVDDEIFLGRVHEQNEFRLVLRSVLNAAKGDQPIHIFLIQGPPGMGKSKLLRRLRDIAAREGPFDTYFQTMLLDWEQVNLRPESIRHFSFGAQINPVFTHFYQAARDAGWGHYFEDYQAEMRSLNRAERSVVEAIEQEVWVEPFVDLRWLPPEKLVAAIRSAGELGEQTSLTPSSNLQGDREAQLHAQAVAWLETRTSLEPEELSVFQGPNGSFARSLAMGFARIAQTKPLVMLLDSCELASREGRWIRALIQHAGPRLVWVISGEGDLAASLTESRGSQDGVTYNLQVLDLEPFSELQVGEYLRSRAPDRLVTRDSVEKIYRLTQGVPLAVQLAADLWASGVPSQEIIEGISKEATLDEVLAELSRRLLEYASDARDRVALVLLSLKPRPHELVLGAVLQSGGSTYELRNHLKMLYRRYRSLHVNGGVSLHTTVATHLRNHLLRRRLRLSEEVKTVASLAANMLLKERERLEAPIPRLEDRFENNEFRGLMLEATFWLFLDNEFSAWRRVNTDFIDGLGYDLEYGRQLVAVIESIRPVLSKNGLARLEVLQTGLEVLRIREIGSDTGSLARVDQAITFLSELERWLKRYGSKDIHAAERRAILDVRRGEIFFRYRRLDDALRTFLKVEANLPARGEALRQQLARDLESLGQTLAWGGEPQGVAGAARPSTQAETCLKKAISLGRKQPLVYFALGAVQERLGKLEAALENLLQSVTLNPGNKDAWFVLGEVYRKQSLHEKAVPAYRRAVELDPKFIRARLSLATCYRFLKQKEEFREEMRVLQRLIAGESEYVRACFEGLTSNTQAVITLLDAAIKNGQTTLEIVNHEPCFEFIRLDPLFRKFVSSR